MVERALDHRLGAGLAIFSSRSRSSEPALTPMRIEQPWSLAALTTSLTRSALPILPGLMRRQAAPALGRFDGALVVEMDVGDDRHLEASHDRLQRRVDSSSGQETRTMSTPASSQRRICAMVALASAVSVLVIDCTVIGASPPTGTEPTMICRDLRRSMSR